MGNLAVCGGKDIWRPSLRQYKLDYKQQLGDGAQGTVYKAIQKATKVPFAIK